jgi:hypothetical protein
MRLLTIVTSVFGCMKTKMETSVSGCSGYNAGTDDVLKENVMLSLRMELPLVILVVVFFAAQMISKTIVTGFAKNMIVSMVYVQLLIATSLSRSRLSDHGRRHAARPSTRK